MRWLKPWSASSGAQKRASARPATSSTAAAAASSTARLFRNDILKTRPGKNRKYQVVESEEAEVSPGVVDHSRPDSTDDDRDDQRQEEKRQQELPCAARGGHRPEQCPDGGEPEVREEDGRDELPADGLEEEGVSGESDGFRYSEKHQHAEGLGEPDRASVTRSENEPVKHALLSLGREGAPEPEEGGEEQRDPQKARRGRRRRIRGQRKVEDDERGDDEEEH